MLKTEPGVLWGWLLRLIVSTTTSRKTGTTTEEVVGVSFHNGFKYPIKVVDFCLFSGKPIC